MSSSLLSGTLIIVGSNLAAHAVASFVSIKLDEGDYLLWRQQITANIMKTQGLVKFVDGSCVAPPETLIKDLEKNKTASL